MLFSRDEVQAILYFAYLSNNKDPTTEDASINNRQCV